MILHLSPTCHLFPLSSLSPVHSAALPRDFTLVSHLSPLSLVLSCSGRIILHLSPSLVSHSSPAHSAASFYTCLPLVSLVSQSALGPPRLMFPLPTLDALGRMFVFLPVSSGLPACLPSCCTCLHLSHFFGLLWIQLAGCFTLVSLLVSLLACSRPDDFTPACFPSCFTCLHLSRPTLDTLGRMFLHCLRLPLRLLPA